MFQADRLVFFSGFSFTSMGCCGLVFAEFDCKGLYNGGYKLLFDVVWAGCPVGFYDSLGRLRRFLG